MLPDLLITRCPEPRLEAQIRAAECRDLRCGQRHVDRDRPDHPHPGTKIAAETVHTHDVWCVRCILLPNERVERPTTTPSNVAYFYPVILDRNTCLSASPYFSDQIMIENVSIPNNKNNCNNEKRPHKKLPICHGFAP